MVKFTNTLLIAAVAAPAFAAPVQPSTREPLTGSAGLKRGTQHAGKVFSGAGTAKSVGSVVGNTKLARDFDELDAREPRNLKPIVAEVRKVAHVGGKTLKHSADAAVVGSTIYSATKSREFDELDAREPINLKTIVTGVKDIAQSREARLARKVISGVGTAATVGSVVASVAPKSKPAASSQSKRDFDELDAREPVNLKAVVTGVKKIAKSRKARVARKVISGVGTAAAVGSVVASTTQSSRDFDELDTREPRDLKPLVAEVEKVAHFAGKALSHASDAAVVGSTVYSATQSHKSREFSELDAREPSDLKAVVEGVEKVAHFAGKVLKHSADAAVVGSTVYSATQSKKSREFDELDAREPRDLKPIIAEAKKIAHFAGKALSHTSDAAVVGSTVYSATQSKKSREFDELDAREPRDLKPIVAGVKKVAHFAGKALSHTSDAAVVGSTAYSAIKSREFDELDAREPLYYILRDEETGEYFVRELSSFDELD